MPSKVGTTPYSLYEENLKLKVPLLPENILGRESGLKTETMSRRHCQIVTKENRWFLADLASTNGTFLNGKKMKPREWYSMKVGDEVEFGSLVFKFNGPPNKAEANIEAPRAETVSTTQPRDGAATSRMKVPVPDRRGGDAKAEPSSLRDEAVALPIDAKGFGIRSAAMLIDTMALLLISFIVQVTLNLELIYLQFTYLIAITLVILVPLKNSGQTLGKLILGLRVISASGGPLTLKQVLLREIIGKYLLFSLVPVAVGALLMMWQLIVGVLVFAGIYIGFAFSYKRLGEPYWDAMFGTRVIGSSLSKSED